MVSLGANTCTRLWPLCRARGGSQHSTYSPSFSLFIFNPPLSSSPLCQDGKRDPFVALHSRCAAQAQQVTNFASRL